MDTPIGALRDSVRRIHSTQVQQSGEIKYLSKKVDRQGEDIKELHSFRDSFESHMDQLKGAIGFIKGVAALSAFALVVTQFLIHWKVI